MHKDIFNAATCNELIERIGKLTPESPAQWGKMNVAQMLAHVCEGFKSATGETKPKRVFMGYLFGKMAKRAFTGTKPFKRNLPTDKSFIMTNSLKEFNTEKEKTLNLLKKFSSGGPSGISSHPHPFFGKMTTDEWNKLMYKHIDHHLQQFGV